MNNNNSDFHTTPLPFPDLFSGIFSSPFSSASASASDIMLLRTTYEERLDEMWYIYSTGVVAQIANYNKQVNIIKSSGLKVLRNSKGKHKIVKC